jgi:hypothetical protein
MGNLIMMMCAQALLFGDLIPAIFDFCPPYFIICIPGVLA